MKTVKVYKIEEYLENVPYAKDYFEYDMYDYLPKVTDYGNGDILLDTVERKIIPIRRFMEIRESMNKRFPDDHYYEETFISFDPQLEYYFKVLLDEKVMKVVRKYEDTLKEKDKAFKKVEFEKNQFIDEKYSARQNQLKEWDEECIWRGVFVLSVIVSLGLFLL
ncbi:hypothetical protein [Pseudoalteromonas phage PH357]|nr:hypothetical protein [Pseudoalteromonas phage PH357]